MPKPENIDPSAEDLLAEVLRDWDALSISISDRTSRGVAGLAIDRAYPSEEDNPRDAYQEDK